MAYEHTVAGTFVSRPNRSIAHVKIGNRAVIYHVKSTGRCRKLLIPGTVVILEFHLGVAVSGRETEHDLIDVYKNDLFTNMDSQVPNGTVWEWPTSVDGSMDGCGCTERAGSSFLPLGSHVPCGTWWGVAHGDSWLDLAPSLRDRDAEAMSPALMEVKDATLEENGVAMSPDVPTKRDIKHLEGLIRAHEEGYKVYILFVIQMKGVRDFTPNNMTRPALEDAPRQAREAGVHTLTYNCLVTSDTIIVDSPVRVILGQNVSRYTLLILRAKAFLWEALAVSALILNNAIPKFQVL